MTAALAEDDFEKAEKKVAVYERSMQFWLDGHKSTTGVLGILSQSSGYDPTGLIKYAEESTIVISEINATVRALLRQDAGKIEHRIIDSMQAIRLLSAQSNRKAIADMSYPSTLVGSSF